MDPLSLTSSMFDVINSSARILKASVGSDKYGELEEAPFYLDVLADTQNLMLANPDAMPSTVPKLLKSCRQLALEIDANIKNLANSTSLQRMKGKIFRSESSSKVLVRKVTSFKSLVIMLRQIVMDSVTIYLLHPGDPRVTVPRPTRDNTTPRQWSIDVTIWGGRHNDMSVWIGSHAYLDTGSDANWVTRDRLERADQKDGTSFAAQLVPVEKHTGFVDFGGTRHTPTHKITLTWYWGARSQTRDTDFFISDAGPFDILIGSELMGSLNLDDQIVLPIVGRRHTVEEKAQMDATAAEGLATADAEAAAKRAAEAAERQRRRQQREAIAQSSHAASASSRAPSVSESG
ncbi:hypothetical protein MMC30_005320 [Trapelia coarctata]|nr:hypothetical protein [Trapelia coarctata]